MKNIIKLFFVISISIGITLSAFAGVNNDQPQKIDKNNSSFENDLFSGIGSYKYDFSFPIGQRGLTPSLSLNYNTARVDYLNDSGYGFNFGVESIFRSTKKGQDKLYTLDEYAINSSFSYNELVKVGTGVFSGVNNNDLSKYYFENDTWIVKDTKGNTYYFGESIDFKQINPENTKTFRWVLSKKVDNFGNEIRYSYIKANNNIYLTEINYVLKNGINPLYKIKLDYLDKTFSTSSYIYGFKLENYKLLSSLTLQTLVNGIYEDSKKYELNYIDENTIFPKLTQIKELSGNQVNNVTSFEYHKTGIGINLLSKIDNGKGLVTTLEYKASSGYENTTVPFLLKTLYKVTYKDTTTNLEYSNTYDYYGGNFYFDPINIYSRGYTGFSKVKIFEDDGNYKYVYFHQSDTDKNNLIDNQNGEFEDHISKKGRIYREEEYDANGKIYTTKITKWIKQNKGNNIYFVMPERVTNILWNKTGDHIDSSETFDYDNFGNVTKNIKYGEVNANTLNGDFTDIKDDKKIYDYKYAIDSNNIFVNEICEEKILDNSNVQISLQKYFYDLLGECSSQSGLLTKKSVFYSEENRYLNQNFTYQNGVLKSESDFLGNVTSYNYDDYNLLPITKTNPKGWVESYSYDYKLQKPTNITDINGVNYKLYYDNFGNIIKKSVINPDISSEITLEENTINKTSLPNYIENKKYSDENSSIKTRIYLDGFGREIETKVSSKYSDKYSTVKTRYDKNGNKEFVTYPKFENNLDFSSIGVGEKGNILTYDTLGRILTQTNKTGVTSFEYDLLKTSQINQKGVKKELINDIFGNLVKVIEHNSNEVYETNYEYNILNKLSKITDAKGNVRNFYYDSLARVKKQEDLHDVNSNSFGTQEYSYNDNSLITSKKVMSQDVINYTYDELGRILSESVGGQANNFVYDVGSFAKGKLTNTSKTNYSEEYKYNFLGQKIENKKIYTDNNYTLKYEFDLLGNITKITYPDNKETNYFYENGYVNKINYNNTEILSSVEYEANNKPKKEIYSHGLINEDFFDYEYGYRLKSKKSEWDGIKYQDISYTFDQLGNITNISDFSDVGVQKSARYWYDDLNRITMSSYYNNWGDMDDIRYYNYDSIGNITGMTYNGDYSYQNGVNPHSLKSTNGVYKYNLGYDINGNVNFENANGIIRNYLYNPKQELMNSYSTGVISSYMYDNNSIRVEKIVSKGNIVNITKYLNNDYEISEIKTLNGSGELISSNLKTSKYIFLGDKKIFTVEESNSEEKIIYNLQDHLGSGGVDVLDNNEGYQGEILQIADYYPYGSTRILDKYNGFSNNYLFTGKEFDDETKIQYFDARYYNPELGRFYSQDRVFWELGNSKRGINILANPQQLNSYSYARNNPLIYVDPSGEIVMAIPFIGVAVAKTIEVALATAVIVIGEKFIDNLSEKISSSKKESKVDVKVKDVISDSSGGSSGGGGKKPDKEKSNLKTNKEISSLAEFLGMKEIKDFGKSHGEKIFKKGSNYYSHDNTAHNGGVWKVFENISGKLKRIGTADRDLNIFKK